MGLRDSCDGFPLLEILLGFHREADPMRYLCRYHDYSLRQNQGGDQRAEYF